MPTGLLLGVAGHADVHRQLARGSEFRRGLQQDVQLALVVDDPARVEPAGALLQRERVGLPQIERIGRLDVDMPVDEHRRGRPVRRRQVADDQRLRVGRDDLGRPAGAPHELGEPVGGSAHVSRPLRIRADAGNTNQLGKLVEPGLSHGARVYADGKRPAVRTGLSTPLSVLGHVAQRDRLGQRAELLQALVLDLADPLARDVERAADLVQRARVLAVEPVAQLEHAPLAQAQAPEHARQRRLTHFDLGGVLGQRLALVGEEVAELRLLLVADRLLQRDRRLRAAADPLDLLRRQLDLAGDLGGGRLTPELGAQLALGADDLVQLLDDVYRHSDRARLVRERAGDRLPDPPGRVGRELESAAVVELFGRAHEPDRPLLDQIEEGQALIAVALGDRHHQAQVGLDHLLLGLMLAALDPLGQLDLLRGGQQVDLADVLQEELQRVGAYLARLLDLAHWLFGPVEDLDVQLLQRVVHLVDLRGIELELGQRERDLLGAERAGLAPALHQTSRFVGLEHLRDAHRLCAFPLLPHLRLLPELVTVRTPRCGCGSVTRVSDGRHRPNGPIFGQPVPAIRRAPRYTEACLPSGEPGSSSCACCSSLRAWSSWSIQSRRTPRWKRTVWACGKTTVSGPRRLKARDGLALSKSPTAAATRASGSSGASRAAAAN